MTPYIPSLKFAAGAIALLIAAWLGYDYKAGKCAEDDNARLTAQAAQIERLQQEAYKADEALQAALRAKPKTGQTVREVIRDAPSNCSVNPAAVDRLRAGARAANQATSAG
jgi:hypothetical protein